jgi:hypothetical protein
MKKNKLNQKDWLVYLNNLNNREISKRSSSGFTTWALLGLIGFALFKLLDSLPIIFIDIENVFLSKLFITNIFNFFMLIIVFMTALFIPQSAKRKIYTELIKKIAFLAAETLSFVFIVGIFCNIYTITDLKYYGLSILPYCVFAIFEIIFIISYLIFRTTVKKENKMPRIDSGYYYNTKRKNPLKHVFVFLCLVLLLSFLFSIYQIKQNYYILDHLSVLKSVIYLIVLIGAIILFIGNCMVQTKNRWLEGFERKIMLQNLDEKEIAKAFIDEFVGKDIAQWLKEIEDDTKEEKTRITKLYNALEKECNSLDQKEKNLNKRIMKEKNIIKKFNELDNCLDKHIEKFSNNTNKVSHFLKQGPLSDEEDLSIREFIRTRNKDNKILLDMNFKKRTRIKEFNKYVNVTKKLIKLK